MQMLFRKMSQKGCPYLLMLRLGVLHEFLHIGTNLHEIEQSLGSEVVSLDTRVSFLLTCKGTVNELQELISLSLKPVAIP